MRYTKLSALREANLLLQQQNGMLIKQNEDLMNRVMSRDYADYAASQIKQEDDQLKADNDDDDLIELEDVDPSTALNDR